MLLPCHWPYLTSLRPLGKKELLNIPVFGWILRSVAVLVDRSNPESRRKSVERLNKIFKRGISVIIFPEGTTNKTDKPLTPFYDGAFRIAIENQGPYLTPGDAEFEKTDAQKRF